MNRNMTRPLVTLVAVASVLVACSGPDSSHGVSSNQSKLASSGEVSLVKASSVLYQLTSSSNIQNVTVLVAVENLAFDKQVVVHLHNPDGSWDDKPCYFLRSVGGNRELWKTSFNYGTDYPIPAHDLEFSIDYQVAGKGYQDDNHGASYHLGRNDGVMLQPAVLLSSASVTFGRDGVPDSAALIDLKNVGSPKSVHVVGTNDHWATVKVFEATYQSGPNAQGVESWAYYGSGSRDVVVPQEFVISYDVDGQTLWDNNFGANYVFPDNLAISN